MPPADFDASRRSSNGFSGVNAMPEFGALVKPLIERPGNAGTDSTPGVFSAMSVMRLMTASVRSSVAASGKLREADEILLVLRRHEAGRRLREAERRQPDQADVDEERNGARTQHAADTARRIRSTRA